MGRCKRDGKTVPRLNWPLSTSSPSSPSSSPSSSSLTFEGGGKVDQAVPAHRWKRASWEEIWIAPRRWAWRALRGQLGRVRNSLTIRCLLIFFVQFCFLMTSCVKCQCKGMGLPRRPLTATHWSWQEGLCVLLILRHETFKTPRLPNITVSSCTPGYIATDLTKDFLVKQGKTAKEAGMKTPAEVLDKT